MDAQSMWGIVIALVAIVMGIGVAYLGIFSEHQKMKLRHEERKMMIEKGMVPQSKVDHEERPATLQDYLKRGVIAVFVGVGLSLAPLFLHGHLESIAGAAGAVVGLYGLGNLVYYRLVRPH